jgi:hypothetical protein
VTAPPWLEVLDEAGRAAATHHRPELAHLLQRKRARLLDPALRVLVIGEPNQGKSQLVNALVNAPVCAVGDDLTTSVSTVVQHSELPSAVLLSGPSGPGGPSGPSRTAERVPVPIEDVADRLSSPSTAGTELVAAEIGIPRRLLEAGVVLVDSPALDNPRRPDFAALIESDVVVLASDATAELSVAELGLLGQLARFGAELVVVLTKIDLVPGWRQVVERDRARLAGAGVRATLVPVSAALRLHAAQTGDRALNAESGFGALIELLQERAAAKPSRLAPRAAAGAAGQVVQQLIGSLRAELASRARPELAAASTAHDAQRRLDELRRATARCQTMLNDEMADLNSDLDYDLRDRARKILREVDRTFDKADPAKGWDEFEEWLQANLTEAAEANFSWLVERCRWIAEKLVRSFPDYPVEATPESIPALPDGPLDDLGDLERPGLERFSVGQKVFTGLRGSYGGVLMFGLVTSLTVGLPLLNPISLGAGAVFGGKSIREEGETRLRRRQAAAKAAAQRHVDDFFLRFGKDCKDVTRHVHRGLRDHFAELASDMQQRLTEAVTTAKQDHQQLRRELDGLVGLQHRIRALAGTPGLEITA